MDEYEVPDELRDEIAEGLTCPYCRASLDATSDVGELRQWEVEERRKWHEWTIRYAKKLDEFYDHLAHYPMLGLKHPLGRAINKRIPELWRVASADVTEKLWFRARILPESTEPTTDDLGPPPLGCNIPEGRFNHQGQPFLYLASTEDTAAAEAVGDGMPEGKKCWVQSFRVLRTGEILDLRSERYDISDSRVPLLATGLMHSGKMDQTVDRSNGWKPEYFIPRFIADSARAHGADGMMYTSTKGFRDNIVLFRWKIQPIGSPRVCTPPDRSRWPSCVISRQYEV